MSMIPFKPLWLAAGLLSPGAAHSAITFYTTPAAFLAAVGQTGVDTYSELDPFVPFIGPPLNGPLARTAGTFSYDVTSGTGELRAGFRSGQIFGGENQIYLETFRTSDRLIFSNFASGVVGLAGNFFNSSFGGGIGAGPNGSIDVSATDADGTVTRTLGFTSLSSFLGVVSNRGSLIEVTAESVVFPSTFFFTSAAVDNLILATAVPEPETYALLLAGLAAVGFMARRRQG